MPTPPTFDVDALLAPIPGPDPAGLDPVHDQPRLQQARETAVEAFDEREEDGRVVRVPLPPNDPTRAARWRDVLRLTQTVLATRSKSVAGAVRQGTHAAAMPARRSRGRRRGCQRLPLL